MEYNARIKWVDNNEEEDVVISTDVEDFDEDYIFYYFEDEEEIKQATKIPFKNYNSYDGFPKEFVVLNYVPTDTKDWYHKLNNTKLNNYETLE